MEPVHLDDAFASFDEAWQPRIVARVNDYDVKIARGDGDFPEHVHAETDEFFLVLDGELTLRMPDGDVVLRPGGTFTVPAGTPHQPSATPGTRLLFFEPRGVVNTGDDDPSGTAGVPLDGPHDDAAEWDAIYRGEDPDHDHGDGPMWSGNPNGTLVVEVADLSPGTALDVGCGEGADAIWLAERGWQVTAIDPSRVAIERGRDAAAARGVDVTWRAVGLLEAARDGATFDLVSAQYPAIRKAGGDAVGALLDAVAPGGTLLVVHHAVAQHHAEDHGFDPSAYVMPDDVAAAIAEEDGWTVTTHETRPRPNAPDDRHPDDVVLRALRR